MEQFFQHVASYIALGLEAVAILLVLAGAVESALIALRTVGRRHPAATMPLRRNKETFVRFASWLVLGLEFELGADVVRTAIAPSWRDVGQLAAIAVIRTFLNYFLERDLDKFAAGSEIDSAPTVEHAHAPAHGEPAPAA